MANGQQKAQLNLNSFELWVATQSEDDFRQITYRGQLNRGEVAKAVGCGKSALLQNPKIRNKLHLLEVDLRKKGVLPPINNKDRKENDPKEYDHNFNRNQLNVKRISSLEQENIELKAKLNELEKELERFVELSDALYEVGLVPR